MPMTKINLKNDKTRIDENKGGINPSWLVYYLHNKQTSIGQTFEDLQGMSK